ncbi:MAG: SIS domain-containing protein, partial [Bacteroidaceae bacterium]|nr:SIS domain-containing protein [Bacteroidaceae bacterium]
METNTYKEIMQQPAVWQEQYAAMVAQKQAIQNFLKKYLTSETEVVLTGAGTSAFIGDAIAPVLRPFWKNVRAVATTDLITHVSSFVNADKPLLLISFARSGNSPESVGAVDLVNQLCKNVAHIYITCNKDGKLAMMADEDNVLCLLLPDATNDKSLAMTSSFSTMLLACLMLSRIDSIEQEQDAIANTIKNAQYVLDQKEQIEKIGSRNFERAVF